MQCNICCCHIFNQRDLSIWWNSSQLSPLPLNHYTGIEPSICSYYLNFADKAGISEIGDEVHEESNGRAGNGSRWSWRRGSHSARRQVCLSSSSGKKIFMPVGFVFHFATDINGWGLFCLLSLLGVSTRRPWRRFKNWGTSFSCAKINTSGNLFADSVANSASEIGLFFVCCIEFKYGLCRFVVNTVGRS